MIQGGQVLINDFFSRVWTIESVLAQKTVKIGENIGWAAVVGSTGTSKRDKINKTIGQKAHKNSCIHGCTSGQSKGNCLSVSKLIKPTGTDRAQPGQLIRSS